MRRLLLGMAWMVLLAACAARDVAPPVRPPDFAVTYMRIGASVPPPYYYEYVLTIAADGSGRIDLTPNYKVVDQDVPLLTETFVVSPTALDDLYQQLRQQGAWRQSWRPANRGVGGAQQSIEVTAGGRRVAILSPVAERQETAFEAMARAIKDAVPAATWQRLDQRRRAYLQQQGYALDDLTPVGAEE